jgi:hypothetical protein
LQLGLIGILNFQFAVVVGEEELLINSGLGFSWRSVLPTSSYRFFITRRSRRLITSPTQSMKTLTALTFKTVVQVLANYKKML